MSLDRFFFDGWTTIIRTLVSGVLAYVVLVQVLRQQGEARSQGALFAARKVHGGKASAAPAPGQQRRLSSV